jgi:hypothetical protein
MPKLLVVELQAPISSRLEAEVARLKPSLRERATKPGIVETALGLYFMLGESERGAAVRGEIIMQASGLSCDNPVSSQHAARLIGVSASTITLIKRELGITRQKVFVREIRKFLEDNPSWNTKSVKPTRRPRGKRSIPGPA